MVETISELSERQIKILKAIIDEYIQSGTSIGSEFLEKKFKLGFSPATIRNEMVTLGKLGFIHKPHISSGRIPTPKAFRLYINSLLPKKQLSTAEEVSIKNEIWDYQDDIFRFLEETTTALAKKSKLLSIVYLNTGFRYFTGLSNLLLLKEFALGEETQDIFEYLEDYNYWAKVLNDIISEDNIELQVLIGEDYIYQSMRNMGGIFSQFEGPDFRGAIGIVGPCRLEYSSNLPLIAHTTTIIKEVLNKQQK
jgi:heat-inducible transcriptional repressor